MDKRLLLRTQQNAVFKILEEIGLEPIRIPTWLHMTIGVLFTIVVGIALAPDAARNLFIFATQALNQILNGSRLLP
jgi:hypothetical protein